MTPARLAWLANTALAVAEHRGHPEAAGSQSQGEITMSEKWDQSTIAHELTVAARDAAQFAIRLNRIFLWATPEARRRLEVLDPNYELDVGHALEDFSKFAASVAEQLLDEMEYPTGGSHREPGYRHFDGAS